LHFGDLAFFLAEQICKNKSGDQGTKFDRKEHTRSCFVPEKVGKAHIQRRTEHDRRGVSHKRRGALEIGRNGDGDVIKGTGFVRNLRQSSSATGATMRTVATLSTNAEITPANSAMHTAVICTVGTLSIKRSAKREGMRLSINSATRPMVPAIMRSTLKSILP